MVVFLFKQPLLRPSRCCDALAGSYLKLRQGLLGNPRNFSGPRNKDVFEFLCRGEYLWVLPLRFSLQITDVVEVNIDFLGVVLFLLPFGTLVYYEDFRGQLLNVKMPVHNCQKTVYALDIGFLLLQFLLQLGDAHLALPLLYGIAFTELPELLVGENVGRHLFKHLCQQPAQYI